MFANNLVTSTHQRGDGADDGERKYCSSSRKGARLMDDAAAKSAFECARAAWCDEWRIMDSGRNLHRRRNTHCIRSIEQHGERAGEVCFREYAGTGGR